MNRALRGCVRGGRISRRRLVDRLDLWRRAAGGGADLRRGRLLAAVAVRIWAARAVTVVFGAPGTDRLPIADVILRPPAGPAPRRFFQLGTGSR
jgi:hypothetical protein